MKTKRLIIACCCMISSLMQAEYASIDAVKGHVRIVSSDNTSSQATQGMILDEDDTVVTHANAQVRLALSRGGYIELAELSTLRLSLSPSVMAFAPHLYYRKDQLKMEEPAHVTLVDGLAYSWSERAPVRIMTELGGIVIQGGHSLIEMNQSGLPEEQSLEVTNQRGYVSVLAKVESLSGLKERSVVVHQHVAEEPVKRFEIPETATVVIRQKIVRRTPETAPVFIFFNDTAVDTNPLAARR